MTLPQCPECSRLVDPKAGIGLGYTNNVGAPLLLCSPRCLADAWRRDNPRPEDRLADLLAYLDDPA